MGGIRGVLHHMQRTAVQASPRVLSAVTRRWIPGTERATDGGHPFRKSLADLRIGDAVVAGPRQVTLADIEHFAEFTGDTFYAHMDEEPRGPTRSSTAGSRTLPHCLLRGRAVRPSRSRSCAGPTTDWRTCASSRRCTG